MKSLSHVQLLATPWTAAYQAPPSTEDSQEKKMTTQSNILAWKIPWTEKPGRLQSMGSQESDVT